MHFFAHEMLSKFQVFEVKHEDKSVTCIHMVSANYMEFLLVGHFVVTRHLHFLILKIY